MYFASRLQAGRMLASQMVDKYRYENCAVVAMDDGGIIVGAQIAMQLHCVLMFINSALVKLPREEKAIAGITNEGTFTLNNEYSPTDLEEMVSENRGFIEMEKLHQMHELNHLTSDIGTVDKRLLKGRNIVLVSDGLKSEFEVDLAYEFLKPVNIESLVFAIPMASVNSVDRMHILGDEIYCINVMEEVSDVNHYYDTNDVPDHSKAMHIIEKIVLNWR